MNHLPHVQYTSQQLVPPGDARKLSSVECAIGKNDSLISPLTGFMNRFKAKRIRNSSWHHSGQSGLNQRYSFTYVFRHNVRAPEHQQVLAPASNTIEGVSTTEVNINSLEGIGQKGEFIDDLGYFSEGLPSFSLCHWNQGVPDKTFYSPFCLQELEQLSWNINNFKLLPAKLGYNTHTYPQPGGPGYGSNAAFDSTMQGLLNVSQYGVSKQTQTNSDLTIASPLGQGDYNFEDAISTFGLSQSITLLKNQAYQAVLRDTNGGPPSDDTDMGGSFRRFNAKVGAKDALADYGKYKCQLGAGKLTFTFVNTGDTTMIVDMVVHKVKEDQSMYQLTPAIYNTMRGINTSVTTSPTDLHSAIIAPYKTNYEEYHNREQDRVMTTYIRKGEDVDSDPKVKFLPTSYRTPVRAQHKPASTEVVRTTQVVQSDTPVFVDIQRQHVTVPANSRKTIIVHLPARQYDPASYNYNCVLNELGYAVTFGVTGKTTRVALPSEFQDTAGAVAARYMGRQAAPTSFHIYGHEMETVMPCALFEKEDYESNNARLPPLGTSSNLQSVVYNPPANRQEEGRYASMQIDNQGRGVQEVSETSLSVKRTADIMEDHQVKKVQKIDFTTNVYNIWRSITDWHDNITAVQQKVQEVCTYYINAIDYLNKHHELLWLAVKAGNLFKNLVNSLPIVASASGSPYLEMGAGLLDSVSSTVTVASIENFLCKYTSTPQSSTKQIEWVMDLEETHNDSTDVTGGKDGGLRRLMSQDIYLIGDGGIPGIGDADKASVERCLGFVKSFFPDALTLTADMFVKFTDDDGGYLDYMMNLAQPVSLYAPFIKGVHWDDGEGNIVPNMVSIDQNQDGIPDVPVIVGEDNIDGTQFQWQFHIITLGGVLSGVDSSVKDFLTNWMSTGTYTNQSGHVFSYPYTNNPAPGYVDSQGRLLQIKLVHDTNAATPYLWNWNNLELRVYSDFGQTSGTHVANNVIVKRVTDWITPF